MNAIQFVTIMLLGTVPIVQKPPDMRSFTEGSDPSSWFPQSHRLPRVSSPSDPQQVDFADKNNQLPAAHITILEELFAKQAASDVQYIQQNAGFKRLALKPPPPQTKPAQPPQTSASQMNPSIDQRPIMSLRQRLKTSPITDRYGPTIVSKHNETTMESMSEHISTSNILSSTTRTRSATAAAVVASNSNGTTAREPIPPPEWTNDVLDDLLKDAEEALESQIRYTRRHARQVMHGTRHITTCQLLDTMGRLHARMNGELSRQPFQPEHTKACLVVFLRAKRCKGKGSYKHTASFAGAPSAEVMRRLAQARGVSRSDEILQH